VHGRIGTFLKTVEMDRGDYSIERLKNKFGQQLGYGVSVQYSSGYGQGAVASDKQLEEALADSVNRGKYNLEVVLVKDGSTPKNVSAFVAQTTTNTPPKSSSSNNSNNSNSSSNSNDRNRSKTSGYDSKAVTKTSTNSSSGILLTTNQTIGGLEEALKNEINKARTNPSSYIKLVEQRVQAFEGNMLFVSKGELKYKTKTHEGKDAVQEAIKTLEKLSRLPGFEWPKTLSSCALEVATKIGTKNVDKNQFSSIIESHGTYGGELKLLRGHFYEHDDAQDLVIHFLVSDGDKNRTSRNILLNQSLKVGGVGIVDGSFPKLCTLQFASEWK